MAGRHLPPALDRFHLLLAQSLHQLTLMNGQGDGWQAHPLHPVPYPVTLTPSRHRLSLITHRDDGLRGCRPFTQQWTASSSAHITVHNQYRQRRVMQTEVAVS